MSRRCTSIDDCRPHNCDNATWEVYGIKGSGTKPDCVGLYAGRKLLILAGADNVWQDLKRHQEMFGLEGYEVMCINRICCDVMFPVNHVATAHPEWIRGYIYERCCKPHGERNKPIFHSDHVVNASEGRHMDTGADLSDVVDYHWQDLGNQVASSGWLGVLIATCMGYDKIAIAGMPLDFVNHQHYYDPPRDYIHDHNIRLDPLTNLIIDKSLEYTKENLPRVMQIARSFSGKTRDLLGEPTLEWWNE